VGEYPPDGGTIREDAMRTGTVWGVTAALALVLGAGLAAAQQPGDDPGDAGKKPGFFDRLFGKKADPPREAAPAPPKETPHAEESRPAAAAESAVEARAREKADLERRWAVCDKIQAIAQQTNDAALERRAEELNQRAWALYQQRTGAPPGLAGGAGGPSADERVLARHLGTPPRSDQAPVPPNLTLRSLDDDSGRTAARRDP
jgi:hypothetical protein